MGFKLYKRFSNSILLYKSSHLISSGRHTNAASSAGASFLLQPPFDSHYQDYNNKRYNNPPPFIIHRRWHFGHSHAHQSDHHHRPSPGEQSESVIRLGLAADIGLATGKAFTGYLSGSTAIIADAAHSVSDVVLSGIALWSFKAGMAPKDKEHPYGHGKFETLGALGISCMLLATAGGIAWHALDLLLGLLTVVPEVANHPLTHEHVHHHQGGHHHGIDMGHPILALSMTIVSISVKEGLYWITKRAGERQGSGLMKANAWHHRTDAISSIVALFGVGGAILGVKFLDPLAGLVVSGMILKAGFESGYQSVLELVDAAIPEEDLGPIKQTILQVQGVKGCHRMRGRRAGSSLYLDVHIVVVILLSVKLLGAFVVDPFLSVSAAHDIGESVRREIHNSHPEIAEVFIHIDPAYICISPTMMDQEENLNGKVNQNKKISLDDKDIELIISDVFSSKFPEKIEVERITRHLMQGNILLQIEISMRPSILIRDAMELAGEAEKKILKASSSIVHVGFLLRLGSPIPKFVNE